MLRFDFNDRATPALRAAADRARDLSVVMASAQRRVNALVARSFARETSPGGVPWPPPVLPQRDARGRRMRTRRKMLVRTRALRRAVMITYDRESLTIRVAVQYSLHVFKRRSPLPVWRARDGTWRLTRRGSAGRLWRSIYAAIRRYVALGRS